MRRYSCEPAGGALAHFRAVALEGPADERGEAARLVLHVAQAAQMLDAVVDALDMAEHHCGRAAQAEPVRDAHDLEPVVRVALQRRDLVADLVDENFAAAAGNRAEPRFLEARDDLLQRHAEDFREMVELRRREPVDVDRRVVRPDVVEQVQVVIDAELRMMPALHQNLRAADRLELLDLFADLLGRKHVRVVLALGAHERAELAVDVADVRVIDVPVDDVGDDLVAVAVVVRALALASARIGQFAQLGQRREIKLLRLLGRDASAVEHPVFDFGIKQRLDHT